jgi:Mn-dependent DtxR family transcriptional regulator
MNNTTQEYLEVLYTLTQNNQKAGTSEIARKLNVAPGQCH